MAKLRFELTKGEEIRYISHLDYASAIERAIIRAKLAAAYSEGFNPHMKISFASALAVGITSQAEYMDLDLKEEIDLAQGVKQLVATLPPGIVVKKAKYMFGKLPALMAIVNLATYDVIAPFPEGTTFSTIEESVKRFNEAEAVLFTRCTPKGRKEVEVKQYMASPIVVSMSAADRAAHMKIDIKITPAGSIKAGEILEALVGMFDLKVNRDSALITRTGLYVVDGKNRVAPIDM
jgi:radical SAM-linked protein